MWLVQGVGFSSPSETKAKAKAKTKTKTKTKTNHGSFSLGFQKLTRSVFLSSYDFFFHFNCFDASFLGFCCIVLSFLGLILIHFLVF